MTPTFEQLNEALTAYAKDDYLWTKFESCKDGVIRFREFTFFMRFGLHLNRPTQAIMAHGHFLRMRSLPDHFYYLGRLEPLDPEACDYSKYQMEDSKGIWQPPDMGRVLSTRMVDTFKVMKENMARSLYNGEFYEALDVGLALFGQAEGSVPLQADAVVKEATAKVPKRSNLHIRRHDRSKGQAQRYACKPAGR